MSNRYPIRKRIAVIKEETTPGTAEWDISSTFPLDADFDVRINNPEVSSVVEFDEDSMEVGTGDHGEFCAISGAQSGQVTFTVPLAWSGTAATAPNLGKLFNYCGATTHAYSAAGVGYRPIAAMDENTCSICIIDIAVGSSPAAIGYLFSGCVGNCVISAEAIGGKLNCEFTYTGKLVDINSFGNANIPELTGADTTCAEKLLSNIASIGGVSQYISGFSIDFGNDVQPIVDQSESTGYSHYYIANRKPRFSTNPLLMATGTDDVLARVIGGDQDAIQVTSGAATHYTLDIPRAQAMNPTLASREGLVNWEQSYYCLRNNNGSTDATGNIPSESPWELLHGARA